MSATHRPAQLNRGLLALSGLLLVGVGAPAPAVAVGLLPIDPATALLPADPVLAPWVPWVGAAVAVLVGLAALRWLAAQVRRRPGGSTWSLPTAPGSSTHVESDVAAAAVAADVATYRGVAKAAAALTGRRDRAQLHLTVHTETGTPVGPLRERIAEHALPRLRTSMGLLTLPTELVLRLDTTDGRRTR